jgi:ABC-type multidrug transport system fused ATPase/permease subunit
MLMVIILMVVIPVNIWMRKKRFARYEAEKEWYHQVTVALMSKNELLQSNTFDIIVQKIQRHFEAAKIANHPLNIWFCVLEEFPRFIFLILRIGTYIFIAKKWFLTGQVDMAELTVFVTMIAVMEKAIVDIFHAIRTFLRHLSGIELLWSTFDSLTPIRGYDSGNTFTPHSPDINISHITYGYNETEIFSDFSLQIASWKKTALVWASGGGKTTLMKLIAGYLHPQSGSISVLGNTLSETALRTYYPHIGYLTQDPWVFDATIRENLISAMSHPPHEKGELEGVTQKRKPSNRSNIKGKQNHITPPSLPFSGEELEQKLIEALKLAQCEFVFELEHVLDTEIWERGVRLSWGQKQRLAIAKIFLKDPEIILLDEPTSALDSFSEEKITEALHTLFEWRTVIIIAHRLQTVKQADDIIVLEWGRVIERGTHEALVETHWVYARMLELQSGF